MSFGELVLDDAKESGEFSGEWWETPLHLRHTMDLPMDTLRAQLPENGSYEAKPYTEHFVEVELPTSEQDAGYPEAAVMHVALMAARCSRRYENPSYHDYTPILRLWWRRNAWSR